MSAALKPYSGPATLARLDGRSRESRLMKDTRARLVAHVGGRPSATQAALIERAVHLTLHCALMEQKFTGPGGMTDHDSRQYLAWSNSLERLLHRLGMKGVAERPPSLTSMLAHHAP